MDPRWFPPGSIPIETDIYIYICVFSYSHMLHVWNIYQHLPHTWPKCSINILYMEHILWQFVALDGREDFRMRSLRSPRSPILSVGPVTEDPNANLIHRYHVYPIIISNLYIPLKNIPMGYIWLYIWSCPKMEIAPNHPSQKTMTWY